MGDIAIRVEHLGKRYRIGPRLRYQTFRDALSGVLSAPFRGVHSYLSGRRTSESAQESDDFIWALKEVSFDVKHGEVIGIIGRNGAGKSTLLKILSRITKPSEGCAEIHGRVGSLLEVGTGFHPELTGRENIYLNGAVLGIKKWEIGRKFDGIVAFAETEKFIDTPVKHYSTGMYMRLAFAVAAHLESEILLVDEVLAVGDAAFQKKCMGKMREVGREGRTIVFVSHNMGAIKNLCSRCLLIEEGKVLCDGSPVDAIESYLSKVYAEKASHVVLPHRTGALIQVTKVWFGDAHGQPVSEIDLGRDVMLWIEYTIEKPRKDVCLAVLVSKEETPLLYTYDTDTDEKLRGPRLAGRYRSRMQLPTSLFKEGTYTASVLIGYGKDNLSDPNACVVLNIVNQNRDLTHRSYRKDRPGVLAQDIRWDTETDTTG